MAGRHRERAEQNGAAPAEHAVGEEAAEDRREINAGGVGAEDRGSERLAIETAIEPAKLSNADDVFDPAREQEILNHVKDKQRLHPVVGKTLPCLGEGEIPEPAWMAEEIGHGIFAAKARHLRVRRWRSCGPEINGKHRRPCKCCSVSRFRIAAAVRIVRSRRVIQFGPQRRQDEIRVAAPRFFLSASTFQGALPFPRADGLR